MSFKAPSATTAFQRAAASGTVDAITAVFAASETQALTLTDQTLCAVISAGSNTSSTPTFAPDGLTAKTITTRGGAALQVGDIGPAGFVAVLEYSASADKWELLNPRRIDLAATGQMVFSGGVTGAAPVYQIDMGSYFDNSGNPSISHINLFGGLYGFGVSTSALNYFSGGGHFFYTNSGVTAPALSISTAGAVTIASTLGVTGASTFTGTVGAAAANFSGAIVASNTVALNSGATVSNDWFKHSGGEASTIPNSQGSYFGWNRTSSDGGSHYVNHRGGGTGGHYFYDTASTAPGTALVSITSSSVAFSVPVAVTGAITGSTSITVASYIATAAGSVFNATGGANSAIYITISNTSGAFAAGVETSVGGIVFSGVGAFEGVVGTTVAKAVHVITNNTSRVKIDSAGLVTFSAGVVIDSVDVTTAWTAYTPTVTAAGGTFTSVSAAGRFKRIGKLVYWTATITVTTQGSANTAVFLTLPVTAITPGTGTPTAGYGRVTTGTGNMLQWVIFNATSIVIVNYANGFEGASGSVLVVSGFYEAA